MENIKLKVSIKSRPVNDFLYALTAGDKKDPSSDNQPPPWQLRYLGQPEIGEKRPTLVRSCYDIACRYHSL